MSKFKKFVLAALIAVGLVAGAAVVANATNTAVKPDCVNLMYPLCARSVAATQVVDNSLPGYKKLAPGSVSEDRLNQATRDKLNAPDTDARGSVLTAYQTAPAPVEKCGGSFKTNKTKLGEFVLPAGKQVKLDAYMFASRTITGAAGTHAQLALRIGATEESFGTDVGTVFQPLSPTKGREVTGTSFWVGAVSQPTQVEIFGFCYNDDQSAAGGGEFTIASRVVATLG